MEEISRRKFLADVSLLTGVMVCHLPFRALAQGSGNGEEDLLAVGSIDGCVYQFDLKTNRLKKKVSVGFMPHSFIQNPKQEERVWVVSGWGNLAKEVDFRHGKVIRSWKAPSGFQIAGHGFHSSDGEKVFFSLLNLETGQGHLVGYHAATLQQTFECTVVGAMHQCHSLDDGTILLSSSGIRRPHGIPRSGPRLEKSSLVRVTGDGKVLGQMFIDDMDQVIGHFSVASDGTIIALTCPRVGANVSSGSIYVSQSEKFSLSKLTLPADVGSQLHGEFFSVAIDEADNCAIASACGNGLVDMSAIGRGVLFDFRACKFLGVVPLLASNIAYDRARRQFISGGNGELFRINKKSLQLERIPAGKDKLGYLRGPHSAIIRLKGTV